MVCKKGNQRKKERTIGIYLRDFAKLFVLRVNEVLDNRLELIYARRSAVAIS